MVGSVELSSRLLTEAARPGTHIRPGQVLVGHTALAHGEDTPRVACAPRLYNGSNVITSRTRSFSASATACRRSTDTPLYCVAS